MSDELPDMVTEALAQNRRQNLTAKAPTEIRRDGQVWTSTTPEMAQAWVDDMVQGLRQMAFMEEIDSWERDSERRLEILSNYFPDQYEQLCEELWAARENVKSLRW